MLIVSLNQKKSEGGKGSVKLSSDGIKSLKSVSKAIDMPGNKSGTRINKLRPDMVNTPEGKKARESIKKHIMSGAKSDNDKEVAGKVCKLLDNAWSDISKGKGDIFKFEKEMEDLGMTNDSNQLRRFAQKIGF